MIFTRFQALAARRRSAARRVAMVSRPELETMEGRQLLAAVPYITISSPKLAEGTGKNSVAEFTVNLTSASTSPVVMHYQTVNKTALAGSDYIATSGTLTFAPGEKVKSIPVTVIGDSEVEPTEAFGVQLSGAQNGVLIGSLGIATILDDDTAVAPKLTINDYSMLRGLKGSRTMTFTVNLNTITKTAISVDVATSNLTAIAGQDYQAMSEKLTFKPGETSKQVSVTIYGADKATADKIFLIKLSNASVELARASGAGVIKYGA